MMRLSLRPYQPTDANVITTWLKNEYLMRQWCADRYECYPVTPEDMNIYHERYIDGQSQRALTMLNGNNIVGYITLRTPADDSSEQRLGFVIVDDSKRGQGFGKTLVSMAVKYAFETLGATKVSLGYHIRCAVLPQHQSRSADKHRLHSQAPRSLPDLKAL